ncbi:MAG: motility protein A [Bdellovibrionaceae bacterium]|nr:motility protein A [Pseudobdellovibrionaceae bacterium]|tara:strand:- start:91275 stop:92048 length:774 start_codon:yes stop_codon:yes gene_type:complete
MDITTLFGIIVGLMSIFIGNLLEGGHFSALIQFTAFLIVFGGTLGATLVSNRLDDVQRGIELVKRAFAKDSEQEKISLALQIMDITKLIRSESVQSLEQNLNRIRNPFMKRVFKYMLDGGDPKLIRDVFESEITQNEDKLNKGAKIWSDAGGFAPTIGIIGAVLGLIHVMSNLSDTSELGKGIAVAFVATVYGVGSANLIFLPLGNKIKSKVQDDISAQEMVLDAAEAITKGANPIVISNKLQGYLADENKSKIGVV